MQEKRILLKKTTLEQVENKYIRLKIKENQKKEAEKTKAEQGKRMQRLI
jgi:hypothetical protein